MGALPEDRIDGTRIVSVRGESVNSASDLLGPREDGDLALVLESPKRPHAFSKLFSGIKLRESVVPVFKFEGGKLTAIPTRRKWESEELPYVIETGWFLFALTFSDCPTAPPEGKVKEAVPLSIRITGQVRVPDVDKVLERTTEGIVDVLKDRWRRVGAMFLQAMDQAAASATYAAHRASFKPASGQAPHFCGAPVTLPEAWGSALKAATGELAEQGSVYELKEVAIAAIDPPEHIKAQEEAQRAFVEHIHEVLEGRRSPKTILKAAEEVKSQAGLEESLRGQLAEQCRRSMVEGLADTIKDAREPKELEDFIPSLASNPVLDGRSREELEKACKKRLDEMEESRQVAAMQGIMRSIDALDSEEMEEPIQRSIAEAELNQKRTELAANSLAEKVAALRRRVQEMRQNAVRIEERINAAQKLDECDAIGQELSEAHLPRQLHDPLEQKLTTRRAELQERAAEDAEVQRRKREVRIAARVVVEAAEDPNVRPHVDRVQELAAGSDTWFVVAFAFETGARDLEGAQERLVGSSLFGNPKRMLPGGDGHPALPEHTGGEGASDNGAAGGKTAPREEARGKRETPPAPVTTR